MHYPEHTPGLDLDPSIDPSTFASGVFNASAVPSTSGGEQYNFSNPYMNVGSQAPQFHHQGIPTNDYPAQELEQHYKQGNSISNVQQRPSHLNLQDSNHQFTNNFVTTDTSANFGNHYSSQELNGKVDSTYDNVFLLDPTLQTGVQPRNQSLSQSINPADLIGNMNSPQGHLSAQSSLVQMDSRSTTGQSPAIQQTQFYTPGHSRHTSLDPASAGFGHGQQSTDWTGMLGGASFQQHRRAPSEHSDVSSSVAPSPFLAQQDSFETYDQNPSPMLNPQQDTNIYQEALGIERFSLSDQQQQQRQGVSPRRSPFVSPHMSPHPGLGIAPENQFMLPSNDMNNPYGGAPGPQAYKSPAEQTFADYQLKPDGSDMGQAAQMAPPEINVELAPPSRQQQYELSRNESDADALSPPERGM